MIDLFVFSTVFSAFMMLELLAIKFGLRKKR